MDTLRVTLVQTEQYWENKETNLQHFEQLIQNIDQTDLILFPEMFHTGFSMNATKLADVYGDSIAMKWLLKQAKLNDAAIYTSFICKEQGKYLNRGVFVRPDGEVSIYDKIKLFTLAKEEQHYSSGSKEQIVEWRGFKIKLTICYDLRFPEIQRNRMVSSNDTEYDVLLNVANWPERRSLHWKTLLKARAIENQSFVVGVNRVGEDENALSYSGDSMVIGPFGEILSSIGPNQEVVETVFLQKETLFHIRERLNFLKDQ